MNQKSKSFLVIGVIIGYMIFSNFIFYNIGRNNPRAQEGYRLREYEDAFMVWAFVPIMDSYIIQGDPIHPARVHIELNTTDTLTMMFEVFTREGITLYTVTNTSIVDYIQEFTAPQEIFINWQVIKASCAFSCPIQANIAIWEWMVLEPEILEVF